MAMGRPKKEINWQALDAVLQFGATLEDAAEIVGVHTDTLARKIKKEHDCTFTEYRDKKMSKIRYNLRKKQYDVAMAGNVSMLIWLGKNMLGQTDKQEIAQNTTIQMPISQEDADL